MPSNNSRNRKNLIGMPQANEPEDRTPLEIGCSERILILPDVHMPYHDNDALRIAVEYGEKRKPTVVLLNGDWGDWYSVSPWETDPRKRNLVAELCQQRQGLEWLRSRFPKARIIYKQGNHEHRWERYLWRNAPELVGLPTTTLQAQIDWPGSRIEWVHHLTPVRILGLLVLHGHEYKFAISNPVSPARGLFLRTAVTSMCSHFHQRSEHSARDGNGRLITTWSTGCLCQLSPEFMSRNNWSHGFAYVETYQHEWDVHNLRVINGAVRY